MKVIAALLGIALLLSTAAGAQPAASEREFRVSFYPHPSKPDVIESGTLSVARDAIRFESWKHDLYWTVSLDEVDAIRVEQIPGVLGPVNSVVIESVEGARRVRRRVAIMETLSLNDRAMFVGLLRLRLAQFREARAAARQTARLRSQ